MDIYREVEMRRYNMNNNIQEDYCSFEVSKLLKEKGLDMYWLRSAYTESGLLFGLGGKLDKVDKTKRWNPDVIRAQDKIMSPTHSLAIKWIRENFNWNIEIGWKNSIHKFISMIYPMQPNTQIHPCGQYTTHEEATEAALLYTLQNLIK